MSSHYKILSLSGGGFRGLYTASVVEQLELLGSFKFNDKVDLFTGTSIGGIIALGLAAGIDIEKVRAGISDNGEKIFPKSMRQKLFVNLIMSKYSVDNLRAVIIEILGEKICSTPIGNLLHDVAVPTVSLEQGRTLLISSLSKTTKSWTVLDAALATSAAPTFFPAHKVDDRLYVDGGISMNVPDIAILSHVMEKQQRDADNIQVLSVGTLYSKKTKLSYGKVKETAGIIGWGPNLMELVIDAQRNTAMQQLEQIMPKERYYRIDRGLNSAPELDVVSIALKADFQDYAENDAKDAFKSAVVKSFIL